MQILLHKEVTKFIDDLEHKTKVKIVWSMELLRIHGTSLGLPYVRFLTGGIFELRIRGVQEIRLLFVCDNGSAIILNAFKKKTQQTPQREIELVKKRKLEID